MKRRADTAGEPGPPAEAGADGSPQAAHTAKATRRTKASRETLRKRRELIVKREKEIQNSNSKESRPARNGAKTRVSSARERFRMEDAERAKNDAMRMAVLDGNSHANWNKFMGPHYNPNSHQERNGKRQKEEASSPTPIAMALKSPTVFNFSSSMFPPVKPVSGSVRMHRSDHLEAALGAQLNLGRGSPTGQMSPRHRPCDISAHRGGAISPAMSPPLRERYREKGQGSPSSLSGGHRAGSTSRSPQRSPSVPGPRSCSPRSADTDGVGISAMNNMALWPAPGDLDAVTPPGQAILDRKINSLLRSASNRNSFKSS